MITESKNMGLGLRERNIVYHSSLWFRFLAKEEQGPGLIKLADVILMARTIFVVKVDKLHCL